ncbi:PFGI-1 class ICE element type IV pilus protein PilL2 [Pseudomonas baetica]|uniref:PFGI-1 class ICE element type IV pilus protein PilL2 n=1 Tax=Pseudomonas baetica TaxID=674054 RepID=UPI002871AEF8|nr:TcpQ domain-containing protein [Pseudomonas baetica]MDR9863442.1 TcpQ domain-containing protein [Pseudomonas baetica]
MIRHLTTLSLLALVASCTTQNADSPKPAFDSSRNPDMLAPDLYPSGAVPEKEPVVRYGRYTLVSTQPDSGQRDLMAQIIDVSIPANMHPSVRDAMQYVVDRSGYSLCSPATGHVNILYTRPLPAAQYKLGPMTLRNTLQVLAGPAWQVKVDEVNRQVCYVLRPGYQLPDPPRPSTTLLAKQNTDQPVVPKHSSQTPASNDSGSAVTVAAVPTPPSITTTPAPVTTPPISSPVAKPVLPPVAPAKDGPSTPSNPTTVVPASASQKPLESTTPTHVVTAATHSVPDNRERAPAPTPQPTYWTAAVGSTLHQTITDWCKRAGWQLIWSQEDLDYPIEAPLSFKGTFAEAIAQIFPLYDSAKRSFVVDGNSGQGQTILYVSERKK